MSSLFKFSNKIENIFGSSGQKVTQKQPKMTVCCCENIWKFNSRTTDPISTKLARYVYHLNTFHFWKLMVSIKGQQRAHPKKSMKICQEFIKVLTLISLKNSLQNAIRLGFFPLSSIIYLEQMYLECGRRGGWGGGTLPPMCECYSQVSWKHNTDVWNFLTLIIMIVHIKTIRIPYLGKQFKSLVLQSRRPCASSNTVLQRGNNLPPITDWFFP